MLRRHSTKSRSDLHRRKSNTPIRSVPLEHIDVAVAQRDAELAAVQAFYRGQDRQSNKMPLFPPQPGSFSKDSSSPVDLSRNDSTASQPHGPGRRQSVRFVGPDACLNSRASRISMRTAAPDCPAIPPRRSIYRSQSSHNVAQPRRSVLGHMQNVQLPDRTSSVGKTTATPEAGLNQHYLQGLAPEHEQYTPEDDVASVPSSYRRLRKTRSMLTANRSLRNSIDGYSTLTPEPSARDMAQQANSAASCSRYSFLNRKENETRPATSLLRAPKSMSFLKLRRERASTSLGARDSMCDSSPVLNTPETSAKSRLLLPKHSKFFGSRGGGTGENTKAKASRDNSPVGVFSTFPTDASLPLSLGRRGSVRNKARKVSSSLKFRFRNLFINKSEDDAKLPAQQIEAQKTHVSEIFDDNPWETNTIGLAHDRERSSLSRVSTRHPSFHAVPPSEYLQSRRGSIESFKCESGKVSEERSRVTSWASSEVNTVIAHDTQDSAEEREKQRLSIIDENGLHSHSPSICRQKLVLQTITSQEELAPPATVDRLPPGATVDSQRVYSALMKRMGETQQLADIVKQHRTSSGNSDPFRTMSPSSTVNSGGSSDIAATSLASPPGEIFCEPSKQDDEYQHHSRSTSSEAQSSYKGISSSVGGHHRSIFPPVHLRPKATGAPVARSITDRSSVFFGTPTSHLFRTTSPYRRSIQEAMRAEQAREEPSMDTTETIATTPTRSVAGKVAYSESNYSEGTQIHKSEVKKRCPIAGHSDCTHAREDGALTDTSTYRPTAQREVSTASSVDWKTWLSADIEKMEKASGSPTKVTGNASEVEYAMPTMPRSFGGGHIREAAQIVSYDEDEYNSSPAVHMPTNPTTPLSAIDSNVVKLSPRQRSVLRLTPPSAGHLQENEEPAFHERNRHKPPAEEHTPGTHTEDVMKPRMSLCDSNGSYPDRKATTQPETPVREPAIRQTKSLARLQNFSRIREPQTGSPRPPVSTTIRLMRKKKDAVDSPDEPGGTESAMASPDFSGAFERQFGSLSRGLGGEELPEKENQSPRTKGHQVRSSKTMVDLFLSSRRSQRASGDGAAFL